MKKSLVHIYQKRKFGKYQIDGDFAIGLSRLLAPRYPCDLLLGGSSPRNHLPKKKKTKIDGDFKKNY